ncbi:hypothetical protein JZ751_000678 [Albula glossodonta]|uniref:Uncharacterized protein n=1 Tax=Albula glossodonta TaxID=121402 RepID=A0A8T2PX94_9TELE|nr:hypothetical protein JZ751_000678 [Albula glossodonta]
MGDVTGVPCSCHRCYSWQEGFPEDQHCAATEHFAAWVDAVVFVFSLEDEISFQTVYNYFLRLCSYRNTAEVPMVLVGTQDAISAANPRVIDDSRARKLSNDLKRSTYYETCSTYGLNVERVFQDVAQKVVALRKKQQLSIGPCKSLPNSPSHSSVPSASIPSVHINQVRPHPIPLPVKAANGGGAFSDYSSSVPSTPSISQREMRIETIAASNTPTPIRKQSKRRSNIFTWLPIGEETGWDYPPAIPRSPPLLPYPIRTKTQPQLFLKRQLTMHALPLAPPPPSPLKPLPPPARPCSQLFPEYPGQIGGSAGSKHPGQVVTNPAHQRNEPLPLRVVEMPKHATYPVWVPEWQAEREFQLMTF